MNITELYEALTSESTGTYVGRKLDEVSRQAIKLLQKDLGLTSNATKEEDLHVTLMYSFDNLRSDFLPNSKDISSDTKNAELAWFGENNDCLVLKLGCRKLKNRHDEIAAYGVKHTYNPYEPHVTLAYDVANPTDIDLGAGIIPARLTFVNEYFDKLDLEWKKGR
ncbi:hypothetical protein [Alishewanella phage vB_AspM_Slicko01]|nr:hypothetical protein [Alishewanella phage vB_AspM_Slicko01]